MTAPTDQADPATPVGCGDCDAMTSHGCRYGLDIIGAHWQDCHRAQHSRSEVPQ